MKRAAYAAHQRKEVRPSSINLFMFRWLFLERRWKRRRRNVSMLFGITLNKYFQHRGFNYNNGHQELHLRKQFSWIPSNGKIENASLKMYRRDLESILKNSKMKRKTIQSNSTISCPDSSRWWINSKIHEQLWQLLADLITNPDDDDLIIWTGSGIAVAYCGFIDTSLWKHPPTQLLLDYYNFFVESSISSQSIMDDEAEYLKSLLKNPQPYPKRTQCFVSSANRRVGGGKCVHKKRKKITRIPCQHQFGCRSGKERRTRSKEQRFYNFISINVSSWDVYVAFAPVKREIRPNQRECIEKNLQFNSHAN